jgi:hypothetical protein
VLVTSTVAAGITPLLGSLMIPVIEPVID